MAGELSVNPVEVSATADYLERTAQEIADDVAAHMKQVRSFLGGDWQGDAATSHENPWTDWENGAHRILASFLSDSGLLRQVASECVRIDGARAEAIGRTGSSLELPEAM
ncbi:WXG100 family type VII secretion target [Nocardia sp. NBC_00511]|uniref:WXG100 family type VII secretion target n=1 Tax=Nocardia sp. NBC_00511 TaxID=2903591 RepID=UPI0030E2F1EB